MPGNRRGGLPSRTSGRSLTSASYASPRSARSLLTSCFKSRISSFRHSNSSVTGLFLCGSTPAAHDHCIITLLTATSTRAVMGRRHVGPISPRLYHSRRQALFAETVVGAVRMSFHCKNLQTFFFCQPGDTQQLQNLGDPTISIGLDHSFVIISTLLLTIQVEHLVSLYCPDLISAGHKKTSESSRNKPAILCNTNRKCFDDKLCYKHHTLSLIYCCTCVAALIFQLNDFSARS